MSYLDIGLVNNMPDGALEATEQQFRALLDASAADMVVRLRFYTLPDVPRGDLGRQIVRRYSNIEALRNTHLDGLIVTGTEPRASNLKNEPYWDSLAQLVQWAEKRTYSTIWSCLAAHAAVFQLDGIARRPLGSKLCGIFNGTPVPGHFLTAAAPPLQMPHSRWNDLPEDVLQASGYRVLSRSAAGVDAFVKQRDSLFMFLQGHPEYDSRALLLEYRRDVKRFLRRERETCPALPENYFDQLTVAALTAVRQQALSDPRAERLTDFSAVLAAAQVTNTWRPSAVSLYRRWLMYLSARKEQRLQVA